MILQSSDRRIPEDGQEGLLRELHRQMLIVATAKMRNRADALDVVQDAWMKILRNMDRLKEADKLFPCAKTIVANTAINALNKRKRSRLSMLDERLPGSDDVYTEVEERLFRHALQNQLQRLDDETRTMVVRKVIYHWKDSEIAESMGFPIGTVKARLHRSKCRLRKWLHHAV